VAQWRTRTRPWQAAGGAQGGGGPASSAEVLRWWGYGLVRWVMAEGEEPPGAAATPPGAAVPVNRAALPRIVGARRLGSLSATGGRVVPMGAGRRRKSVAGLAGGDRFLGGECDPASRVGWFGRSGWGVGPGGLDLCRCRIVILRLGFRA
jgi:hypothetical protein